MVPSAHRGGVGGLPAAVLLLGFLGAVFGPAGPSAQPGGASPHEIERRFKLGLAAGAVEDRVRAVQELAASGHPDAFGMIEAAHDRAWKSRDRIHQQCTAVGRQLDGALPDRAPLTSPTQRDRIVALDRQVRELTAQLRGEEQVVEALRVGLGEVWSRLSADRQAAAAERLSRRLRALRAATDRSRLAALFGYLEGAGPCELLASLAAAPEPEVRMAALVALGRQKNETATAAVRDALDDPFWQVRATAIEALVGIGGKAAVEALILALARAEGRIQEDIAGALARLTGQNAHVNPIVWQNWWAKNKAAYQPPPEPETREDEGKRDGGGDRVAGGKSADPGAERDATRPRPGGDPGGTTFYGIQSRSKRLIYILDISGSMLLPLGAQSPTQTGVIRPGKVGERKIDQAYRELRNSITALPEDATFNIVFYNEQVDVWKKGQMLATAANKKKAIAWAESVSANGATNIFDAVERAFGLAGRGTFDRNYATAADTFYLLSDGLANRGRLFRGPAMLAEILRINALNKVKVHTIALGGDADIPFMSALARRTGGSFAHFGPRGRNADREPDDRRPPGHP